MLSRGRTVYYIVSTFLPTALFTWAAGLSALVSILAMTISVIVPSSFPKENFLISQLLPANRSHPSPPACKTQPDQAPCQEKKNYRQTERPAQVQGFKKEDEPLSWYVTGQGIIDN
jgi:hypothetical protein